VVAIVCAIVFAIGLCLLVSGVVRACKQRSPRPAPVLPIVVVEGTEVAPDQVQVATVVMRIQDTGADTAPGPDPVMADAK
jgi:hypothetical protein